MQEQGICHLPRKYVVTSFGCILPPRQRYYEKDVFNEEYITATSNFLERAVNWFAMIIMLLVLSLTIEYAYLK